MPGSIAACAVSRRLFRVNFAGAVTWSDKTETEAFQASGGLNASRIQAIVITATILTFLQTFYVQ